MKEGKGLLEQIFIDLLIPDVVVFGAEKHRYKTEVASAYLSLGITILEVGSGRKIYVAARDISAFFKLPGCYHYTYHKVLGEGALSGKVLAELAVKEMLYPAKLMRAKGE